eukprot:TRINITY_DN166_c0_g1_i2.p1 TRINITY_DN166_c0_g1~~TRINITY_DN166_c0_g1_i2.p1  ORF type:complete len:504 (+),score=124.08 TRINITY_DN166_c0_g1_i2:28-1512(+)
MSFLSQLNTVGALQFAKFQSLLADFVTKDATDLTTRLMFLKDAAIVFGAKSAVLLPLLEAAIESNELPDPSTLTYSAPAVSAQNVFCALPVDQLTLPEESFSVFVGDLQPNVTEEELKAAFASVGDIKEAIVIKDKVTQVNKGYGFLHFRDKATRERILTAQFAQTPVGGRIVRLKRSEEKLCVFVGNIDGSKTPAQVSAGLHHVLDQVIPADGLTIEVKGTDDGRNRGYAFVTCRSQPYAELVKQIIGATSMSNRTLVAKWADSQKPPNSEDSQRQDKDVYVANLALSLSDDQLRQHFSSCGEIYKCMITRDPGTNKSKGFGFIGFTTREGVDLAISMNDTELLGQRIRVSSARSNHSQRNARGGGRGFDQGGYGGRGGQGQGRGGFGSPYGNQGGYGAPGYGNQQNYGRQNYGGGYGQQQTGGYGQQQGAYPQPYGAPQTDYNYPPAPQQQQQQQSYTQRTQQTTPQYNTQPPRVAQFQTPHAATSNPYASY